LIRPVTPEPASQQELVHLHYQKSKPEKMKKTIRINLFTAFLAVLFMPALSGQEHQAESDTLVVLWTSGDIEVAEKIVYMYVYNAKKASWFDEVVFIIWGPSAKLLSENTKLQKELKKMQEIGIRTEACVVCARMYGVDDDLSNLGVDVKGMGKPLSDYLKRGYRVLTF
jgi:hypothetical protein